MIPTYCQERIERLMREQHLTYAEAWATLGHDPEFRPFFEAMEGKSKVQCNGPAHPGRFSGVKEYNRRFETASNGGGGTTYLANLSQSNNQQTTQKDPNMKDPGNPQQRGTIVQNWIDAARADNPQMTYREAWNAASAEEELKPLFAAMIRAAANGNSDGVNAGAYRGPDMSAKSLGKQPDPGSRDKDGYPSGFAAGPAINALRAATGNKISQHPG